MIKISTLITLTAQMNTDPLLKPDLYISLRKPRPRGLPAREDACDEQ